MLARLHWKNGDRTGSLTANGYLNDDNNDDDDDHANVTLRLESLTDCCDLLPLSFGFCCWSNFATKCVSDNCLLFIIHPFNHAVKLICSDLSEPAKTVSS